MKGTFKEKAANIYFECKLWIEAFKLSNPNGGKVTPVSDWVNYKQFKEELKPKITFSEANDKKIDLLVATI